MRLVDLLCHWPSHEVLLRLKGEALVDLQDRNVKSPLAIADSEGKTALISACDNGDIEALNMLLEHGARIGCDQVNFQDNNGRSALIVACKKKQMIATVTKILLENGAEIDLQDVHGRTALSFASENSNTSPKAMGCLLEGGAQVNLQDNFGRSPLMIASECGIC